MNRKTILSSAVAVGLTSLCMTSSWAVINSQESSISQSSQSSTTTNAVSGALVSSSIQNKNPIRSSELMGSSISNAKGEMIGTVNDFLVDPDTGKIKYAVLDIDKGMSTAKSVAIPMDRFSRGSNSNKLVLNVDKSQLAAAPQFDANTYAQNSDWSIGVDNYFRNLNSNQVTPTGVDSTTRSYDSNSSSNIKSDSSPNSSSFERNDSQSSTEQNKTSTTP